jgi:hypothetical protein
VPSPYFAGVVAGALVIAAARNDSSAPATIAAGHSESGAPSTQEPSVRE